MKYLWATIKHKWFVFLAGMKTKAPIWRLIIHDWSKFLPSELPYYNRQFFGDQGDPEGFAETWCRHQNRHPHHWEHWIPRTTYVKSGAQNNEPIPMPMWAVREMVADWMGASRSYDGLWPRHDNGWKWWENNKPHLRLHYKTWPRVYAVMYEQEMVSREEMIDLGYLKPGEESFDPENPPSLPPSLRVATDGD